MLGLVTYGAFSIQFVNMSIIKKRLYLYIYVLCRSVVDAVICSL